MGRGNIQSIAAGVDRNIYFYFSGGTKRKTIACFGRFETATGVIRILAREDKLADASRMGDSLTLAHGDLVAAGRTIWLWLHHSDGSAMFQFQPGSFPADGEIALPYPTIVNSEDGTLNMTRPGIRFTSGPGDSALLMDIATTALWKMDLTGRIGLAESLVGLPRLLSTAGANNVGDIGMFAASSEPIVPTVEQRSDPWMCRRTILRCC